MVNNMKKRLTQQQEFEILKLVLDKFLWLGTVIMGYGLWKLFNGGFDNLWTSLIVMAGGAIVLLIFSALLIREFEVLK